MCEEDDRMHTRYAKPLAFEKALLLEYQSPTSVANSSNTFHGQMISITSAILISNNAA